MKELEISSLFSLENTISAPVFEGKKYPFEVLGEIGDFILSLGKQLDKDV